MMKILWQFLHFMLIVEISMQERHYQDRCRYIQQQESNGINMYPHHFPITTSIPNFISTYDHLESDERLPSAIHSIAGRVMEIRSRGRKMRFYAIQANGSQLQIFASIHNYHLGSDALDEFKQNHGNIRRGDIIGITGYPGRTSRGTLSIFAQNTVILAPCLHEIPYNINNREYRYRNRYLDLMLQPSITQIFETRAKIIAFIRRFLDSRGFLEVETPILNQIAGGGNAKKFETIHNSMHLPMYLRIAPELYLKRLVIGGLDRVYEIGRQFRNEDMDQTHNPEFTSCEFYCAYWDYNDLMNITEEMISTLVYEINGSYIIQYHPSQSDPDEVVEIDFSTPWNRYDMIGEIETRGGFIIPRPFDSDECNEFLQGQCRDLGIGEGDGATTARLLDRLCGYFIEDRIRNPAFIINHPAIMSPLAKNHRDDAELTERFECFVMGKELCNAYTELNHPWIQRERFMQQARDARMGDDEAMDYDEDYCRALEYGLPPTAGWGLGIDRLTMWLTDQNTINEVILFPQMKPRRNSNNREIVREMDGENNYSIVILNIVLRILLLMCVVILIYNDELSTCYGLMQESLMIGTFIHGIGIILLMRMTMRLN